MDRHGYGPPHYPSGSDMQGQGQGQVSNYQRRWTETSASRRTESYPPPNVVVGGPPQLIPRHVQGHGPVPMQGHGRVPVQGHSPIPMQGHSPVPMQGHGRVSVQGHSRVSVQGHSPITMQGHGRVSVQGHSPVPMQGHSPVPVRPPAPVAQVPDLQSVTGKLKTNISKIPSPMLQRLNSISTVMMFEMEEMTPEEARKKAEIFFGFFRKLTDYMNHILKEASENKLLWDENSKVIEQSKTLSIDKMSKYFLKALSAYLFTTLPVCDCIKDDLTVLFGRLVRFLHHYIRSETPTRQEITFQCLLGIIQRDISCCKFNMTTIIFLWKLIQLVPEELRAHENVIIYEQFRVGVKGFSIILNNLLMKVVQKVSEERKDTPPPDDAEASNFSFQKDMEIAEYLMNQVIVIPGLEIVHQNQHQVSCLGYRIPVAKKKLPGDVEVDYFPYDSQ